MGDRITPKFVFVLLLALSAFAGSARAQVSEVTHSPHGKLTIPCQNCHTANAWRPIRAVPEFDHNQTRYPLRGMHTAVACSSCHVKMVFSNVGQRCQDCHADIHRRQLGANCEQCHTVRGWQVAVKDVEQHNNRFPLTGAHAAVDCSACHKGGANSKFQLMSTACDSCHLKDFTSTTNPSHVKAQFSTTCENCHTTDNWLNAKVTGFDHSTTGFVLSGGHAVPPRLCADCHVNNNYTLGAMPCFGCHQKDFASATAPVPHTGFPNTCETCHDTVQWSDAKFDHSTTGFTLTGLHTVPPRQCSDCHVNNNYTLSSTACVTCHLKDFQGTTNPNHVTSNFPQTCDQCHTTGTWQNASFNHDSTGFSLSGMHAVPPRTCTDCHVNNNYNLSNAACVSCHLKDFQGATNPNHATANFPQTCEQCHNTSNWTDAKFNHDSTGFSLTGMHTVPPRACTDCHVNNNYNLSNAACVSCHLKDFQGTTNPNHVTANFPQTCAQCHQTSNWTDAKFNHDSTGFALTGMHAVPPRACTDCHVNNNYTLSNAACVSCHLKDFQGTTNPNHVTSNFPQTCEQCHSTSNWMDAKFNHDSTGFSLTGMHTVPPRACTDCHVNNNYTLSNAACVSCHLKDFQGTTNPNHVTSNFPQTCEQCHSTSNWMNAKFNHDSTGFSLTGMHTVPPRACTDCHVNNNYNLTSNACVTCHLKDFQGTTNPNHVTSNFPQTCEQCHSTSNWMDAKFNHDSTGFSLTGMHTVPPRACTDCHVNNNYNLTSAACATCHLKDFQGTTNPNHVTSNFPQTCADCHSTSTWLNATFNHDSTGFPLTGLHTVPPRACTDCHVNNNYNLTSNACVTCHLKDFQGTTNPNHVTSNFPQTCATCHSTSTWLNATFNHDSTGFPLTGLHTVPPRACTDCHVNGNYNLTSNACVTCHLKDFQGTTNPNHVTSNFPQTCATCHTTSTWLNATFNHDSTGFPLTGLHTVPPRACTDCHVNGNYNLTSNACVTCHLKDFQGTTNPNHVTGSFPQTCDTCHNTAAWQPATFDHSKSGFPLTGSHMVPPRQCSDCHVNNNYNITVTTCVSCHQTDYNNATTPVAHTGFPTTCQQCHDTVQWTDGKFDHSTTGFTLTGMHTVPPRACADCHVNNNYNLTSTACATCHLKDFQGTTNPNHVTSNFPQTCADCHSTSTWLNATFNHDSTGFPLTGLHTVPPRACTDCHVNGNYNLTSNACVTCHLKDFQGTTNPNHVTANFPQTCATCHSTSTWLNATFNHDSTGFPLTGLHTVPPRACTDCHVNGNYNLTSNACVTCHLKDFQGTTNPNHVSANFPQTCNTCHDTTNWMDATFNHASTGFTLTGLHTVPPRACTDCHVNNNYSLSSAACVTCHLKDYQGTTNPNHVTANFPQTCDTCHDTANWTDATFNHASTGFTLTGMHTVPPRLCTDCHVNNNYNLTSTACATCHLKDYQGTTNPNHVTANFPQTCETCHDTANWMDATFNHTTTGFPLTGLHTVPPRACTDCHVNNNYTLSSTACVTCHLKDYQGTTNPNHVTANFPQTCNQCHSTTTWLNATFNHDSTGFPLTGLHTVPPRACTDCHVNNNYTLTSTACVTCHLKDYQGTTNPNHVTANFPQTCDTCHDTANWMDATFNHSTTGFTLTGMHTVPPRACTDCHVNNNYSLNSTACVTCHLKDYQGTTNPNHVTANFPQTCNQCHDTNTWTDATFNHTTTGFPLTGLHTVPPRACTDCHVNNNYNLTSAACVSCHLKDYQGTTNPNHVTANFPQTCDTCHDTTNWMDATFNHASTGFTLTGLHTVPPRACTDCHVNNNYSLNSTACVTCHLKDYQGTTNPNHVTANFPQTCDTCHDTSNWMDATFNHASTGFTLTGSHTVPPRVCTDCHVNNNYNLTSKACVTCHQTDYNNATTPVAHAAAGFPTTCDTCHDTVQWTDGKFDHSTTGFPLTNSHTVPPRGCTDCHVNNNYSLNSTLCYSCHQKDYTGTTNPAHSSAGFPTTCETCHDTINWTDSTFNHNNTGFPLTGMHTVPPRVCSDCHVNNNYNLTSNTCITCHQSDYNGTTNPAHSTGQNSVFFPSAQCSTCHTTSAWTGATFNHTQYTRFPTTHGNANSQCATCHINGGDYSVFQCTGCHGNNNANNFQHDNVNGYVYNSINCYQCHASGNGG